MAALNEYFDGLGLAPDHQQRLLTMAVPPQPVTENYGAPTPEEIRAYGGTPADVAAATRGANAIAEGAPITAAASPTTGRAPANDNGVGGFLGTGLAGGIGDDRGVAPAKYGPGFSSPAPPANDNAAPGPDVGRVDENTFDAPSPARSPGRYVPAHWQPGSRSETIQHGIDESRLAPGQEQRAVATNYAQWAADDTQKAAAKEAAADVAYAAAHHEATVAAGERMRALENEKQAYVAREHEKLDALSTAAQAQVDPEAAKGSMGSQLLAAIGIALGQFGASLNGGTNTALQIVDTNINRRIAAQRDNIANAHKALGNEQGLYKENLAAFGDRERASLATKVQYLDQAKALLDQQYAGAKSNRNEAQYHAMSEGIANKRAEYLDQFGIRTADQRATQGSEHYVPGQTVGGGGPTKDLENLVTLPNGSTVQAANKEQANKIIDQARVVNGLQSMNNRALNLRKELFSIHPLSPDPSSQERITTIQKELEDMEIEKTSLLSSKSGEGVQKENEFVRNAAKRGFYTAGTGRWRSGLMSGSNQRTTDANLRAQNERLEKEMEGFATAGGAHVVKRGRGTDAQGNVIPVARFTGQTAVNAEQLAPYGSTPMKSTLKVPTAERPLAERTPYDENFGSQGGSVPSSKESKGDKGRGPTVKKRK